MNKESAQPGRLLSQHPGSGGVYGIAEFAFYFRLVDSRVGTGVDDDRRLDSPNQVADRMLAAEIAFRSTDHNHIARGMVQAGEFGPYLSVFAGNQDSHASMLSVEELDRRRSKIVS
jgi:hypothetical protein